MGPQRVPDLDVIYHPAEPGSGNRLWSDSDINDNSDCKKNWCTCKLNNVDHVCRGSYTWIWVLGHHSTLVSSHDMLQGVPTDRPSQNFTVCPSYLTLKVCRPCVSLRIIHRSQIQKCTAIGLDIPEMHTTRWIASVLIVFLERLADFMKNRKFYTIPAWKNSVFYIGIQN